MAEEPITAPDKAAEEIIKNPRSPDPSSPANSVGKTPPSAASPPPRRRRLFGREKPLHKVFGGGKTADVLLWRDKKISSASLGAATAIWVLFELLDYHLLTLVCHCLILCLTILFLWPKFSTFINKTPPRIPEVSIPEDVAVKTALALRNDINQVLSVLREIALGRDLKHFLIVVAVLWALSVIGSYCDFLTLLYTVSVTLHTVPIMYERYEDKVDQFAERVTAEMKQQYEVFDAKVLSKIPRGPVKDKRH